MDHQRALGSVRTHSQRRQHASSGGGGAVRLVGGLGPSRTPGPRGTYLDERIVAMPPERAARSIVRATIDVMGLTFIDGRVQAPGRRQRGRRVRFLVDSGAVYS